MSKNDFDGFTVNVFLDDDGDWVAHFIELPEVSAFAETPNAAAEELQAAWDLLKESYRADGKDIPIAPSKRNYSGQFNIRIDRRVHRALAIEAAKVGLSLNALVAQKLAKGVRLET